MLAKIENTTNDKQIIDKFGFLFLIPMYIIMTIIASGIMIPILLLSRLVSGSTPWENILFFLSSYGHYTLI